MKSTLTDNLGLKLLSLLLGSTLWYTVAREQGAEFAFSIPIELRDVPEGLEVIEESVQQVDVRLRGPAETLRGLTAQDLSVGVDLSDAGAGTIVEYLSPEDVSAPFGARVMRITPASLQIELDHTLEKEVNVIARVSGAPAAGFELNSIALQPNTVTVGGPASRIRDLDQVTTELLSAEGLRQPYSRKVQLELDPLVRLTGETSVVLTLNIVEERIQQELADISVRALPEDVDASLVVNAVQIVVDGPRSVVEGLSVAEQEQLEAEVRLDGLPAGEHSVPVIVRVPNVDAMRTLRIVSVKPEQIEVRIR